MRKDIEEPMSPVRNKNLRLGKKKISNGVSEGPEQIASDLAKVVRGDVFADEWKRQRKTLKREFLGRVKILDVTLS